MPIYELNISDRGHEYSKEQCALKKIVAARGQNNARCLAAEDSIGMHEFDLPEIWLNKKYSTCEKINPSDHMVKCVEGL